MTAAERYVADVIARVPYEARLRDQIAMEVRGHIAERVEHGGSEAEAIRQLGDPVALAESYLAAIPLVSGSFLGRVGAKLIDLALFAVIVIPIGIAAWMQFGRVEPAVLPALLLLACIILVVPGFAVYTAIAEHQFSRTIGKHLMGLRVVRESGGRIGFGQALVRQLPMFFEVFWVDVLFALFTDKSQRAFEMVSKTRVVKAVDVPVASPALRGALAI